MAKVKATKNDNRVRVALHGLDVEFEVQRLKSGSVAVLFETDNGTTFRAVLAPSEARRIGDALCEAAGDDD